MKHKLSEAQLAQRRANGIASMARRTPQERSAMGKKGFAVCVARHGREKAFEAMLKRQIEKPSSLEVEVEGILRSLGLEYVKQVRLSTERLYTVDFVVGRFALEVDGPVHDLHDETRARAEKDALAQARGLSVVHMHHSRRHEWPALLAELLAVELAVDPVPF